MLASLLSATGLQQQQEGLLLQLLCAQDFSLFMGVLPAGLSTLSCRIFYRTNPYFDFFEHTDAVLVDLRSHRFIFDST